jgi:hypothetical protein
MPVSARALFDWHERPGAFERLLETDIGTTPVISRTKVERRAAQYRGTRP